jgi:hypothetical protein
MFFSLISTGLANSEWSFIFKRIEQHLNAFFGEIVTISVAALQSIQSSEFESRIYHMR